MKRTAMLLLGAMLALSLAGGLPARAGTPPDAAIQGTWALGSSLGDGGYNVATGTLTFDGKGGVTGIVNFNNDGEYCVGAGLSGTYVVNPGKLSGTATMTLSSVNTGNCGDGGDGDILTLSFFLAADLKTMNFVEIDQNVSGTVANDFGAVAGPGVHF